MTKKIFVTVVNIFVTVVLVYLLWRRRFHRVLESEQGRILVAPLSEAECWESYYRRYEDGSVSG